MIDQAQALGGFYLHKLGTKRRRHPTRKTADAAAHRLAAATGGVVVITEEVGRVASEGPAHD